MNATITILTDEPLGTISPMLHGHFAEHLGRCCNDGLWVGTDSPIPNRDGLRTDVVDALARLGVPQLRWPGGCYADTYHWRDGIGPRNDRPRTLGESCGLRVVEDNGLGTHEFIALCRQIGAEPYLAGNVGSGTAREMMDWVHYCNGSLETDLVRQRAANGHPDPMRVRYWGVGNENWGCGGNYDAVDYAKEYRRYATFLKQADPEIEMVACGGYENQEWNLRLLETLRDDLKLLDHVSLHQYYDAGPATGSSENQHYALMRAGDLVEEDLRATDELISYFTRGKKQVGIAFDEWGVWHPEARSHCNYEAANTQRDAVAAAGVLDTFQRWCGRVSMANLAQIVNVLQTPIQTDGDRMWVTPTYHLFMLYKPHRGATALRSVVECDRAEGGSLRFLKPGVVDVVSSCASETDGQVTVSVSNRRKDERQVVSIRLRERATVNGTAEVLAAEAGDAANSADCPDSVMIRDLQVRIEGGEALVELPPCSVATIVFS
jgi:alpha-L-arabinofuranosidase